MFALNENTSGQIQNFVSEFIKSISFKKNKFSLIIALEGNPAIPIYSTLYNWGAQSGLPHKISATQFRNLIEPDQYPFNPEKYPWPKDIYTKGYKKFDNLFVSVIGFNEELTDMFLTELGQILSPVTEPANA